MSKKISNVALLTFEGGLKKLKVPIAFYVLLILCNKAFLFILDGLML
jgi:hypothetical protein